MIKKDRESVTARFDQFMAETVGAFHNEGAFAEFDQWIIRSPFGPVSVRLSAPQTHRSGFTLFCQVLWFPSNYPNGIRHWYQFDHWKQNCHLSNSPDVNDVVEAMRRHVLQFGATPFGRPDERELFRYMVSWCARSTSHAKMLEKCIDYYEKKYESEAAASGVAGEPPLESLRRPVLAGCVS